MSDFYWTRQIAERVNARRRERGLSIRVLAKRAGLPKSTVAAMANPWVPRRVSFQAAASVARALDVSLDWIAGNERGSGSPR